MLIVLLAGGFGSEAQEARKGAAFEVIRASARTWTSAPRQEPVHDIAEPGARHHEISADMKRRLAQHAPPRDRPHLGHKHEGLGGDCGHVEDRRGVALLSW